MKCFVSDKEVDGRPSILCSLITVMLCDDEIEAYKDAFRENVLFKTQIDLTNEINEFLQNTFPDVDAQQKALNMFMRRAVINAQLGGELVKWLEERKNLYAIKSAHLPE